MQDKPKSPNPRTKTSDERLSLTALIVVLTLTNVWFFTQVMTYVH